jgi:hypothetical protein
MDKSKIIIAVFALLSLALIFFGTKQVKSIKAQIVEQKSDIAKLYQQLEYVDNLESNLETAKESGGIIGRIPQVNDPIANQALMNKFIQTFLARMELMAEVKVDKRKRSKDFPDFIGVDEVPLLIGIKDYTSYGQVMKMLNEFRKFPFGIEILCIGGSDVPIPGNLRIKMKYYIIPEAS